MFLNKIIYQIIYTTVGRHSCTTQLNCVLLTTVFTVYSFNEQFPTSLKTLYTP